MKHRLLHSFKILGRLQISRWLLKLTIGLLCLNALVHAAKPNPLVNLDFTQGGTPPKEATHDWTLGATGTRGWIYSENLSTSKARQIYITKVSQDSPADQVLEVGDVILGVGGKDFSYDPRTEFGKALAAAESEDKKGILKLKVWRKGKVAERSIRLPVLGTYTATAPYDCPKSERILSEGCRALAKRIESTTYRVSNISRSLNAMALLASGNNKYLDIVKKEAEWAADFKTNNFKTWHYGYVMMFLAEYVLATNDRSVLPGLRRLAVEAAEGQSLAGSWGHDFTDKTGRIGGYGMMNAPSIPLAISLELARRAGVEDEVVKVAIKRSTTMFRFYIGKGSPGYGDYDPWIRTHEDNGKSGMAAVLFNLLEEPKGSQFFSRMSLASHGAERDSGHTGNFWNMAWAMPGVNLSGPKATGAWMNEFGSWYFDLARGHDHRFLHQGPPAAKHDKTKGWDATGAYLLAYAMPKKKLIITGRDTMQTKALSAKEAMAIISDGKGWTRAHSAAGYSELVEELLIKRLSHWSPVVRQRAANEFGRRATAPVEAITQLLDSSSLEARLGACATLAQLKGRATPAVPKLRKALKSQDMWLRIQAARALAAIGKPVDGLANELLKRVIQKPGSEDPRGMEQRYLCFALFDRRGLINRSQEGVDRELLIKAMQAGLQNEDGRCRGAISNMFPKLKKTELIRLMPDIHQAVTIPAPSGAMFANVVRMEGLKTMADNKIEEGLKAGIEYFLSQPVWGSKGRNPEILHQLSRYGVHAHPYIPKLENCAAELDDKAKREKRTRFSKMAQTIRQGIEEIKKSTHNPNLTPFTSTIE